MQGREGRFCNQHYKIGAGEGGYNRAADTGWTVYNNYIHAVFQGKAPGFILNFGNQFAGILGADAKPGVCHGIAYPGGGKVPPLPLAIAIFID